MSFFNKRFWVSLGLGVGIWVASLFVQALFTVSDLGVNFSILGSNCEVTGYPLAKCLSTSLKLKIFLFYLVNILFWFLVIYLPWGWFKKA